MIQIEITGPGGTLNYPTEVIVRALKEAGLTVELNDRHPSDKPEEMLTEMKERLASGYIKEWKISVITNHQPWGG